VFDIEMS